MIFLSTRFKGGIFVTSSRCNNSRQNAQLWNA